MTVAGSYDELVTGPVPGTFAAVCSTLAEPPRIVVHSDERPSTELRAGCMLPPGGGHLQRLVTKARDGTSIRSWLALPAERHPAPLLIFVHGGPLQSWNAWTWRWNPWWFTLQGYAVLLPDPALSTGYGREQDPTGLGRMVADPGRRCPNRLGGARRQSRR